MRLHDFHQMQSVRTQPATPHRADTPKSLHQKFKRSPKSASCTHLWETEERLILITLREVFENDWDTLVLIFNAIFKYNVPEAGLTKNVLKTQYDSITRDPRHRIDKEKLWEMIASSSKSILKSEKEGKALIKDTALEIGVHLIKKKFSIRSTALDASSPRSTTKRSCDSMIADETVVASIGTVSDSFRDLSNTLPRKRWSGLNQMTSKTPQTLVSGLKMPPSSEQRSKHARLSRYRTPETPAMSHQQKGLTSLTQPFTRRLASPTLSSATEKTETASSYALSSASSYTPSTAPPTEFFDESSLRLTPTLYPGLSTETEFFSAHSTTPSTEDENEDENSIQTHSISDPDKNKRAASGDLVMAIGEIDIPLLGYRAFSNLSHGYNSDTRFISGLYQDSHTIPPCPAIDDDFYISEAEKHVGKNPSPTPFISLSSTPLRALILAFGFRRRKSCKGSYLAIINLKILKEAGIIQKAKSVNLRPVVKYFPANEFLVWGEIKSEAIISVVNIADLLNSPPRHRYDQDPLAIREISKTWKAWATWKLIREVNRENQVFLSCCMGYAVGQLPRILKLPDYCLQSAVDGIVHDWGLTCSKYERWQDNHIFCEFVQKGYNGIDISQSPLDSTSTMTVRVKEEEISFLPCQSPVIISSDDEADGAVYPDALIQDLHEAAAASDVMCIDNEDYLTTYELRTDKAFATLPAHYEMEMGIDKVAEWHKTVQQMHQSFALLPTAYESEMADLEYRPSGMMIMGESDRQKRV